MLEKEKIFYNCLSLALESNHRELKKIREKNGSWEKSWKNYILSHQTSLNPENEFKKLKSKKIELLLIEDKNFPPLLKEIPWPPYGIYIQGSLENLQERNIAIVGTRKATSSGKEIAFSFSKQLSEYGLGIISGLALGIDTESHKGALENSGATFAVLALGLDSVYPKTNTDLSRRIIEKGGALISEYPLQSPAFPNRFLERNRIISGLSNATLIIEAPENSGALATARFALDQNREIFVIPGPIYHPNFKGSNKLIRDGATLVTSPEEIIEIISPELLKHKNQKKGSLIQNASTPEEKIVLDILLKSGKTVNIDKIVELTNLNAKIINQTLSFLVIKNIVKETENGYTL